MPVLLALVASALAILLAPVLAMASALPALVGPPAPTEIPDTPVGQRAQAWFIALESADDDGLEAMMTANFNDDMLNVVPMQAHIEMANNFRGRIVEYHSIIRQREDHLAYLCRTNDGWAEMQVNVTPEPPHLIAGLGFLPAEAPEVSALGPSASDDSFAEVMDHYVASLGDEFSGSVLVTRSEAAGNSTPVYSASHGESSKAHHTLNNLDTRFNLGSANKLFTAIAINQLAEQGKLNYHDLVGDLLPDYPNQDVKSRVTVHHLLTHTGGTGSHFKDEFFEQSKLNYRDIPDFIDLIADNGVAFEPGSQMAYSNAGFFILGAIVEAVSGQEYHQYIRDHVTGPAGATRTDCYETDMPVENLATGYMTAEEYWPSVERDPPSNHPDALPMGVSREATQWRANTYLHSMRGGPAGGGYSTVVDLARIADAFMADRLVSEPTRNLMTTKHTPFGRSERVSYGYGVIIETEEDGLTALGHGGDFLGIQTRYAIVPDRQSNGYYVVAAMTNYAGPAARVFDHALRVLPRR